MSGPAARKRAARLRRAALVPLGVLLVGLALVLSRCGREGGSSGPTEPAGVVVESQDIAVAQLGELAAGPVISGSLRAGTEATIRAEIAGTVADAAAEEGEPVTRGQLLARISDPTLTEQRRSAESAVSSAQIAAQNARRDVERTETLLAAGAVARRDLESARNALAAAESQLSNARSQAADVAKAAAATTVQAPIAGIVSAKLASTGDVVQIGAELYRVVDPSSMMLEASVPAEQLVGIEVGAPVHFDVRGYPGRTFAGKVERINPSADPATRQVSIHVSIPNAGGELIAGLFAEGMVTTTAREALTVPADAVDDAQGQPYVTRIRGGVAQQTGVRTGLHDQKTKRVEVVSGLAAGDTVLVGPTMQISPGTPVRVGVLTAAPADGR